MKIRHPRPFIVLAAHLPRAPALLQRRHGNHGYALLMNATSP